MSVCPYFVDEILIFHNVARKISININIYGKFRELRKELNVI
jgi:hypothetical protein